MVNALRLRTARKWERARQEQKMHECHDAELRLSSGIREWTARIDHETRCNMETEMFLMVKTDSLKSDSVKWMNKYEEDYDAVEVDIQVCTDQLEELRNKLTETRATLDKRIKQVSDYLEAKANAESARLFAILAEKSAILLQAWWRGTMVRKKLGPYRKKRKGKKKKKK